MNDKFWFKSPEILFKTNRLTEFFPTPDMSSFEKLNAITRLSLYISLIMYFYSGKYLYLFIFILSLLFTYMLYKNISNINESIDEFKNIDNNNYNNNYDINYVKPTKNNPFMNITMNDYINNPNRESLINKNIQYDSEISKNIEDKFNINLYRDVNDVFQNQNSQRQFYTTAITTIPNNQDKFANWLYNVPPTCKEGNGLQCVANNYNPLYKFTNKGDLN